MLLAFAFIFMVLAIEFTDKFWKTTFLLLDIVIWFFLAASVMEIEIPYQFYNASSDTLESGYQIFTGKIGVVLPYFFLMFAAIMIIYFVKVIFQDVIGSYAEYRGRFKRR